MIIDGKSISAKRKDELKIKIEKMKKAGKRIPQLTVILVGNNQASQTYVRNKERGCAYVEMCIRDRMKDKEKTLMILCSLFFVLLQ